MENQKRAIGLVVAIEMDAVLAKYGEPAQVLKYPGFTVRVYEAEDSVLYAADSGAGELSAAMTTQFLISVCHVDLILNFGVVGALEEDVATAELCVVERVIHYDFDTTGWLNLPRGQYPGEVSAYLETTPELVALARSVHPQLRPVTCASADKFVDREADKRALKEQFDAQICEMEAAAIVMTSRRNGVPCLLLKAVSDTLTGGGKEFMTEVRRVSAICFDILDQIIHAMGK